MDKYNMVLPRITYSGVDALEDLRQVVAAERNVHAEAQDRVRHMLRDGRDE